MKQVCVFLADGFEEIEGLTVVDVLRRAGVKVTTVSIKKDRMITGRSDITVLADVWFGEVDFTEVDMLVLPGGMPGTTNLRDYAPLTGLLKEFYEAKKLLAAICAAPMIFGALGFLQGRSAAIYPGMEDELKGAQALTEPVVVDEFITTSRGMGTAIPFALSLVEQLLGAEKALEIKESIVY
ncbi:MAG: DJ-1/PfpI family protein [Lachnospiraceae bacterium]|nr:DJ-1/PfpI family protein [Lachnospiraceae bacterium]